MFSKIFSLIDIGNMNFDGGDTGSDKCIAHSDTGMGVGCRIDYNSAEVSWSLLNPVNQFTFIIRLTNLHGDSQLLGEGTNFSPDFFQCNAAINFRLALAQEI